MSDTEQKIKRINEKIQQLLKSQQLRDVEYEKLSKDNKEYREREQLLKNKIDFLEQKVSVLKSATNQMEDGDKKELEKRLNHYLKEIDRCITLLSE